MPIRLKLFCLHNTLQALYYTHNMNVSDDQLQEIAALAEQQKEVELQIKLLSEDLERATEKLNKLSMSLIPEAMMAIGMESFKLKDGTMVKVEKFYSGKIPDDKQGEAFAWLRKTGNDSLIKREIKLMFGKGEDVAAQFVVNTLKEMGHEPLDKQSVHPMTLKSFIREQFETAAEFPADLFGAYVGNKTKIASPKQ